MVLIAIGSMVTAILIDVLHGMVLGEDYVVCICIWMNEQ